MKPLRCPKCMATTPDTEFLATVPYRATFSAIVEGIVDGELKLDGVDRGDPHYFQRPTVYCQDCGHEWPTTRSWRMD